MSGRKKRSEWMQGLLHAEKMVTNHSMTELVYLVRTHEYVDADPEFFIGVTDYIQHHNEKTERNES